jgi:hypothetical protein
MMHNQQVNALQTQRVRAAVHTNRDAHLSSLSGRVPSLFARWGFGGMQAVLTVIRLKAEEEK